MLQWQGILISTIRIFIGMWAILFIYQLQTFHWDANYFIRPPHIGSDLFLLITSSLILHFLFSCHLIRYFSSCKGCNPCGQLLCGMLQEPSNVDTLHTHCIVAHVDGHCDGLSSCLDCLLLAGRYFSKVYRLGYMCLGWVCLRVVIW